MDSIKMTCRKPTETYGFIEVEINYEPKSGETSAEATAKASTILCDGIAAAMVEWWAAEEHLETYLEHKEEIEQRNNSVF